MYFDSALCLAYLVLIGVGKWAYFRCEIWVFGSAAAIAFTPDKSRPPLVRLLTAILQQRTPAIRNATSPLKCDIALYRIIHLCFNQ